MEIKTTIDELFEMLHYFKGEKFTRKKIEGFLKVNKSKMQSNNKARK